MWEAFVRIYWFVAHWSQQFGSLHRTWILIILTPAYIGHQTLYVLYYEPGKTSNTLQCGSKTLLPWLVLTRLEGDEWKESKHYCLGWYLLGWREINEKNLSFLPSFPPFDLASPKAIYQKFAARRFCFVDYHFRERGGEESGTPICHFENQNPFFWGKLLHFFKIPTRKMHRTKW